MYTTPHVQTRQAPRPSYTAPSAPQTSYGAPNGQSGQETLIVPVPIPEPYPVHYEGKLAYQGHPVSVHPNYPFLPSPAHAQPVHPPAYTVAHLPPSTYHPPEQTLLANILLARAYAPTTATDLDSLLSRYSRN